MAKKEKKSWIASMQDENKSLKEENKDLKSEFEKLSKRVDAMTKENPEPSEAEVTEQDDRTEMVVIHYGSTGTDKGGQRQYVREELPKNQAIEKIVEYYVNKKYKIVPRPDTYDPGRNKATCYCRVTKRDLGTGRKVIAVQEMPIWLAAQRILENKAVELITKTDYDRFYKEKEAIANQWKEDIYAEKRKQLMDKLIQSF